MDGIASGVFACHQHDILSRQAMMYLLTRGWSLAHTSLDMMPELCEMSEEYCCLKSARAGLAGHSKSMCLSSPKACMRHSPQIRLLRGNRTYLPCSMGNKWDPMRNLRILWSLALPMGTSQYVGQPCACRPRESSMVCAHFHPIMRAQPGIEVAWRQRPWCGDA